MGMGVGIGGKPGKTQGEQLRKGIVCEARVWSLTHGARVVRGDALISSSCCDKSRGLGGLNNKHLFPTVLEAEVQDQGACTVGLFVRALFLVLALHGLFLVCALGAERERE